MSTKIASHQDWLTARKALLEKEKELTRITDAVATQLRDLPMVKIDKSYVFRSPSGDILSLKDLFQNKKQLIIYHYMFDPTWDKGCAGCSFVAEHLPDIRHLGFKDTALCAVSRAPIDKIVAYKEKNGWKFPWYSSGESDFNYDFQATQDEAVRPVEYNFESKDSLEQKGLNSLTKGEMPGLSVFFLDGEDIYHTYSTYARGLDKLLGTFTLLDMTPLGRQVGPRGPAEFKRSFEYDQAVEG